MNSLSELEICLKAISTSYMSPGAPSTFALTEFPSISKSRILPSLEYISPWTRRFLESRFLMFFNQKQINHCHYTSNTILKFKV